MKEDTDVFHMDLIGARSEKYAIGSARRLWKFPFDYCQNWDIRPVLSALKEKGNLYGTETCRGDAGVVRPDDRESTFLAAWKEQGCSRFPESGS